MISLDLPADMPEDEAMTTTAANTLTLRMNPWAWDILTEKHGWDECPLIGDAEFAMTDDGEKVTVVIDMSDGACQDVDMIDAANHCMKLEGWDDEKIEVVR